MIRSRLVFLKHISFALLALLFLTCALEVGLRLYDAHTGKFSASEDEGRGLISRSWVVHHQLKPLQTLSGQNPDTNQAVVMTTNSLGLRGREPVVPKPPGVYRIICLGDESVFSPELNERETFCAHLQELLQSRTRLEVDVINAGVPGYCPLLSYLQVKHTLLALQPDLLILNFDMSDVADDHRYRRHTHLGPDSSPLACPNPRLDSRASIRPVRLEDALLITQWCKRRLGALSTEKNRAEDQLDISAPLGRYAWLKEIPPQWSIYIQQALLPVGGLKQLAGRVYARFVLVAGPAPWQISAAASSGNGVRQRAGVRSKAVYESREPFDLLATYAGQHEIPICDPSLAFRGVASPERLFLHNAPRFSAEGQLLYARVLAAFLVHNVPGVWNEDSLDGPQSPSPPPRHAFSPR